MHLNTKKNNAVKKKHLLVSEAGVTSYFLHTYFLCELEQCIYLAILSPFLHLYIYENIIAVLQKFEIITKNSYLAEQNDTVTKLNFIEYFPLSVVFPKYKFQGNKVNSK